MASEERGSKTVPVLQKAATKAALSPTGRLIAAALASRKAMMEAALNQSADHRRKMEQEIDMVIADKEEAERSLREHVTRLHRILDQQHGRHLEALRQHHKEYLQQVMVAHTEIVNYEAGVADMEKQITEMQAYVTEKKNLSSVDISTIMARCTEFESRSSQRPSQEVEGIKYRVELPCLSDSDVEVLIGKLVTDKHHQSAPSFQTASDLPVPSTGASAAQSASALPLKSNAPRFPGFPPAAATIFASTNTPRPPKPVTSTVTPTPPKTAKEKKNHMKGLLGQILVRPDHFGQEKPTPQSVSMTGARLSCSQTQTLQGRANKEPIAISPRKDGKVWVVYDDGKHRLDLVSATGAILTSKHFAEEPEMVACVGETHVLVSMASPRKLVLLDSQMNQSGEFPLSDNPIVTSVSVGSRGVAVSFTNSLYWIAAGKKRKNVWIVPAQERPRLTGISSTAVLTLDGTEFVFAAVRGTQEVVVFEQDESEFLVVETIRGNTIQGMQNSDFRPINLSAHHSGIVGVLNSASDSVIILDARSYVAIAVILCEQVCAPYDCPCLIAFGQEDEGEIMLYVTGDSNIIQRTPLTFHFKSNSPALLDDRDVLFI